MVVTDGRAPDVWWYGRRAGGLYGWDRLPAGTWVGAWVRVPLGRWSIEMSADARGQRWDLIGALAHVSPLLANFMFVDLIAEIGPSTIPLHGFFILLELSTIVYILFSKTTVANKES